MEPRLKTSNQWSFFPNDITELLKSLITQQFSNKLPQGEFIVEGKIYPEEIQLRLGHVAEGNIGQNNFEGSMEYKPGGEKVLDVIQHLYEATLSMMDDFVKNPEADLPILWKECKINSKTVFLQHSKVNSSLEAQADQLLGIDQQSLIHKDEELQIEELKTSLGLNQTDSKEDKKEPTVH